jgi:hypothetical protein
MAEPPAPSAAYVRLRRLWDEHRHDAFPAGSEGDPRFQEVALYASWLGGLAEAALARGGRLAEEHRRMLEVRRAEGNATVWNLAGGLGGHARAYVARLMALEEALAGLPAEL